MSYTATIVISILSLVVLLESLYLLKNRRKKVVDVNKTQEVIREIRKTLRENHLSQKKLYKDIDVVMAETSLLLQERSTENQNNHPRAK